MLLYHSVDCVLWCTEIFNFDEVQFIWFCLFCLCFWCHIQEIIANSNINKHFPYIFFKEFYSFRSYVYVFDLFWVSFWIWGQVRIQLHSFVCGYPVFWTPFVEKTVLSVLNDHDTLLENYSTMYARVYFWALSCMPLVYTSFCQYHTVLITITLWIWFYSQVALNL